MLTAVTFSLLGFIIGIWADGFEKLQLVPLLIVTPLTFLGGSFYSIDMLPPFWQKVTLFNPVVYLISGFRWSFYGMADVSVGVSLGDDARVHGDLPRDRRVDLQDRVPAENVATSAVTLDVCRGSMPQRRTRLPLFSATRRSAHLHRDPDQHDGTDGKRHERKRRNATPCPMRRRSRWRPARRRRNSS